MDEDFSLLLRRAGLRVTQPRLAFLAFLATQRRPVSLRRIAAHITGVNLTTVYRMVDAFLAAGIILGCDVGHGHVDYELASLPHHHHAVCTSCGTVEEVDVCLGARALHARALATTKTFARIDGHQVMVQGTCRVCFAKKTTP